MNKFLSVLFAASGCMTACVTDSLSQAESIPSLPDYCRVAQQVVTRTEQSVDVRVHDTFDAFVKSKAIIPDTDGAIPEIQQFHWLDPQGDAVGVSCKLKSVDHLNLVYGQGTAGPDGRCQDMNRYVYRALIDSAAEQDYAEILFDEEDAVMNDSNPGMVGPDWLKPYEATYADDDGRLHVRTKWFRVNFSDPRFARAPERFRGVQYCHFIAPDHLLALMTGNEEPGVSIGRVVDTSGFRPPAE